MQWILYIISIVWLSLGASLVLYTPETRRFLQTAIRPADPRPLAALSLIFGLLLIVAAPASHYPWFVRLLGIMGLIKAGFFFLNPENFGSRLTTWYLTTLSERSWRLWGVITVILATALFSWVR